MGAKEITFGVAWETSEPNLDLDSLVVIFDKWGNHVETIDGLSRTSSRCGSINHHGDDVTGGGDGDAETIGVNLTTIEKRTEVLVLVINIMRGNFKKVESIRSRIICEVPDNDAHFGTGKQIQPEDEMLVFEQTCVAPDENSKNTAIMLRLRRIRGGHNRWVAQKMGNLCFCSNNQDLVTQIQETLLDLFPKLKIRGKDMGLRSVTDVMNRLDVRAIHKLEQIFAAGGADSDDGLNLIEFCECMIQHLDLLSGKEDKIHIVSLLTEMFNQVDVDGDGTMEWEEFTAFVIQNGLMATQGGDEGNIQGESNDLQFVRDKFEDRVTHGKEICVLEYFSGLKHLIVCSEKSDHVKMFDKSCNYVRPLQLPEDPRRETKIVVLDTEYCHEENVLAVSASDFSITLWDMRRGRLGKNVPKILRTLKAPTSQISMVWSHKHRTLFTAGVNLEIIAWNVKTQEILGKLTAHKDMIMHVICIDELDMIVSAGLDDIVYLYGINEMKKFGACIGHKKGVRRVCWGHNMLFSCGFEYNVRVWEIDLNEAGERYAEGKQIMTLKGHVVMLLDVQIVPGEAPLVVTCDVNGTFKLWDVGTFALFSGEGIELQTFTAGSSVKSPIRSFFISPQCESGPIPGSEDNPEPLKPMCTLIAATNQLLRFSMVSIQSKSVVTPKLVLYNSSTMKFFSVSGPDVHLWDAGHGGKVHSFWNIFENKKFITSLTFDGNLRKFIAGSEDGHVVVFNSVSGEQMKAGMPHKSNVTNVIYCKGCRCIVSASTDGKLCILNEDVEEQLEVLRCVKHAHSRGIYSTEYCEPLALISTGSSDGTLRIWDFVDLKMQCELIGHSAQICAATFVPPYNSIFSVDCSGVLFGWLIPFTKRIAGDPGIVTPTIMYTLTNSPENSVFTSFTWNEFPVGNGGREPSPEPDRDEKPRRLIGSLADDKGYITEFDFNAVIDSMNKKKQVENLPCDHPNYNPHLKFNVYSFKASKATKSKRKKFTITPAMKTVLLNPTRRFQAHSDAIQHITHVLHPPMLVTCSFDDNIRLFSEAVGDDDDPLGEMTLKPATDEDGEAEWLVPLEGTNLSHKHREEAIKLMNRAEKEEQMLNLKLEKERLKQTQRLEDRERYDREGSLKEIVYSNKDLGKTIKHLRNQMELFDSGNDPKNQKLGRLQAMLDQVKEGEEADMNMTWGEFFEDIQHQKGVAKAFSHSSIFQGSLNGSFGGEEIARLEMIRKRGMYKIYEYFPPVEEDSKSKTMMPSIGDNSSNSAAVGYLNFRKELKNRGGLSKSTSEKQLDMALNMAKPSKFLLDKLGPKKSKEKKRWRRVKSQQKTTPFFTLSMESTSIDDVYQGKDAGIGTSFFITGGESFISDNSTDNLPAIENDLNKMYIKNRKSTTLGRKFKGGRYGNSIEEIMKSASKILEESDERVVTQSKKKKRRKLHEVVEKRRGVNENQRKPRKKSISRRQSTSTKSKGQWRIRHYQKQEVMEVINSFKKLDDDLTGEIEISEFLKLPQFEGMDKATVDHLFRTIDKDGGGSVTQAELLRVMFPKANDADLKLMEELAHVEQFASVKQTKNVLSRQQRDDIEKIFDMYDTDNSNSVSLVELLDALGQKLQGILSAQEISDIFDTADMDGNRDLDRDEFVQLYQDYFLMPVEEAEESLM